MADGEERRLPKNLTGLLQFALNYTKSEDAPNASTFEEIDQERKEFLEHALRSLTVDVMKEIHTALATLDQEDASIESKEAALTMIRDHICQIDFANSFAKLGGAQILLVYAKHPSFRLRKIALATIAEMSQSNPVCQQLYLDLQALEMLVTYFLEEEDVAKTSIYAVSAIVRNYEPALARFIEIGGVNALVACLKRKEQNVFIKAAFLIGVTSDEFNSLRDEYVKQGAVEILLPCIEPVNDYDVKIETCLRAVSSLTKSKFFKPNSELKKKLIAQLQELLNGCQDLPQCEEMVQYTQITITNIRES